MSKDSIIKLDKIALRIAGVMRLLSGAFFLITGILCVTALKGSEDLNRIIAESGVSEIDGMSIETLLCIVGVVIGAFYILYGVLSFKATKPKAKRTALIVVSTISTFVILYNNATAGFSWGRFISLFPDILVYCGAFSLNRLEKGKK